MISNAILEKAAAGHPSLGAWCFLPGTVQAEAYSSMGFDYVAIDLQHGLIDASMAENMIQAVDAGSATPIVRVPSNDEALICRMLDYGARGVIVPMVNTADDARKAVAACRYAPKGGRSFGPIRMALRHGAEYIRHAQQAIMVIPMIETKEALENLDEILAVEGVDAVYVGPADLSLTLGLPPKDNDGAPAFEAALKQAIAACREKKVIPGIHADPATIGDRLSQGFKMATCAQDLLALVGGMGAALKTAAQFAQEVK